jgi:hypothetical protein
MAVTKAAFVLNKDIGIIAGNSLHLPPFSSLFFLPVAAFIYPFAL